MITIHRLNGTEFILNDLQIETMEATPDTIITLINEKKYVVKETTEEIVNLIIAYQGRIHDKLSKKE